MLGVGYLFSVLSAFESKEVKLTLLSLLALF